MIKLNIKKHIKSQLQSYSLEPTARGLHMVQSNCDATYTCLTFLFSSGEHVCCSWCISLKNGACF